MKLSKIFDVRYGHSLELNRLQICQPHEGYAFVSRKSGDNGIAAYVRQIEGLAPAPAGELTLARLFRNRAGKFHLRWGP